VRSEQLLRGFTLVEVMVALTILSLIMLATVSGLRTLASTQRSLEQVTERADEIRSVSSVLRDLFESAVIGSGSGGLSLGGGSIQTSHFQMGERFVEWKARVQFGERYGGTHLLRLTAEEEQLVLRWLLPAMGPPRDQDWLNAPSRVLVKQLDEFRVAWRQSYQHDWQRKWRGDDTPALLRLRIKAAGRHWPDLVLEVPQ
jgi:general secretion pathway protein J